VKKPRKPGIAVAMSGGVDSSVAAALLKKEGRGVIGVTFRMWPKEECGSSAARSCCSLEAVTRARAVAHGLGIPYYVFDFSEEFKKQVIGYFCDQYLKGFTPNPCVICNERIKFGALFDKARSLGADIVATGHFTGIARDKRSGRYLLKKSRAREKDQTYFLFSLSQDQLKHSLFPLEAYDKAMVRAVARRLKLPTFDTASSQDVCFIKDNSYAEYIRKKTGVDIKCGDIVDASGKALGRHKGIPFYTIGQRRGLGIAYKEPLYVTGIEPETNRIVVGTKKDVLKKSFIAERMNWISIPSLDKPRKFLTKIRYNHKETEALVTPAGAGSVRVDFEKPQEAPTPGQAAVFYEKRTVVGGGWIREVV
jgi:tRNA-specific 2-thiouridylase